MRSLWKICAVMASILVVGCGTQQVGPAIDASSDAVAPTTEVQKMTMGTIIWAESTEPETGEPSEPVTAFTTESTAIIAIIEVANVPAGTEFTATWTLNDTPVQGSDMHVVANAAMPQAWVAFQFTREEDQRYPPGLLSVVITSSDGNLRDGTVEIGFP